MGLSDESEWKVGSSQIINAQRLIMQIYISQEKLKEEEKLRKKLEERLFQLQWKMSKYKTELWSKKCSEEFLVPRVENATD